MSSKQEKLAAARKKLKEFQGKNKEIESFRQKVSDEASAFSTTDSPFSSSELLPEPQANNRNRNIEMTKQTIVDNQGGTAALNKQIIFNNDENSFDFHVEKPISSFSHSNEKEKQNENSRGVVTSKYPEHSEHYHNENDNKAIKTLKTNMNPSFLNSFTDSKKDADSETAKTLNTENNIYLNFNNSKNTLPDESNTSVESLKNSIVRNNVVISENLYSESFCNEQEHIFNKDHSKISALSEVKPFQAELKNYAETINILIQQRNDIQSCLSKAQTSLTEKSDEVEKLNDQVKLLTSSINEVQEKFSEAEKLVKTLKFENEENLKKKEEEELYIFALKDELNSKEEKFEELKKKFEDKNKECQNLTLSLQKTQSQLAISQIQVQQFSAEKLYNPIVQLSELQKENLFLKQQLEDMEKKCEADYSEKNQNYYVYAQMCNSQLSTLNLQIKSLTNEKETLSGENAALKKKLFEMESLNKKEVITKNFETEFQSKMDLLLEENNTLKNLLKKKEDDCLILHKKVEEKDLEINNLNARLNKLEAENEKLIAEAENPKPNDRLLAVMESDKVAAAKAVSQNQKLKQQVVELEEAFVKLSQEKLDLTDQLGHERHVNCGLQKLLKDYESAQYNENHDHHKNSTECLHEAGGNEGNLVNDSNEIEELRIIVRQLQDDKIELKARLSAFELSENHPKKDYKKCHGDVEESECETTKLLLQKMEEKVRKTMNEIAALDEEKEKLEHLVLQLQGETETIGEYITLYQTQRRILRQRAQEKDNQLQQLSKDKEELKSKLSALDELVQHLLEEKRNLGHAPNLQPESSIPTLDITHNTAEKIRALINEIGSTTWVSNQSMAFEHCSCCSGRLITV